MSQLELWPEEAPGEPLNWSVSRDKRLKDCARRYYLHHYGSRGGIDAPPSAPERQALILRSLRSRYMWVGEVVHELIALLFGAWRRGEVVPVEAVVERGTRRMRAQYAESVQGVYRDRPLTAMGLIEHEYKEPISRDEWRAARDRMERCLRGFYAMPFFEKLRQIPIWRWLAVESLGSFDLDGATIAVKPDFAWRDADGRVFIVDWKTGKARVDDERLQLLVYGLFARRNWGVREDGFSGVVAYLDAEGGAKVETHELSARDLDEAQGMVQRSVDDMRAFLHAGDPEPERFPMTAELERCGRCAFRRLCGR